LIWRRTTQFGQTREAIQKYTTTHTARGAYQHRRRAMSKPTKEYYQAKADLCRDLAIKQMVEGEHKEAGANLIRMVNALNELELINYKEGKDNEK
jgi:hypothetical protein